jgi:methyl-accepting chemotaxis protein
MFDNMKLGTRIWVGFGAVLGICALLGGTAVVSMTMVKSDTTKLDEEYVPEVAIANELERNSLETMYQVRGYTYTYDANFLTEGKKHLAEVHESLKKAEDLAQKSVHLVKLKDQVKTAKTNVEEYSTLLGESEKEINDIVAARHELDKSAAEFLKSITAYIASQDAKMEREIKEGAGKSKLLERYVKQKLGNEVIDYGNAVRVAAQKSQALRDIKLAQDAMGNFDAIEKGVAKLIPMTRTAEDMKNLENVRDSARTYKKSMMDLLSSWGTLNEISAKRGKAADAVLEAAKATSTAGIKATEEIAESAASSLATVSIILIIGLIAAVLLGGFIAFTVSNSIGNILSRISAALGLASRQVRDAASQMSSASQQLASSSAEQASSIEETTASVEEMAGMVTNNVEAAARASELSQKVSSLTEQGNETMRNLTDSMKDILLSNEQIEHLVKVIAAIGEKTKVMDEIVFQTKLLSFNASVEAERAGEHGRGFAVVAQEVGNLAQMSGKAAQEISQILTESISKAETITTDNKRKVEGGGHLVAETASALKEIAESAGSVTNGANQVLGASKEQASGIKQVNVAMTTLEKATQENSALAEEVASTSEEMASQCQGLDSIVAELTRLVHGSGQGDNFAERQPTVSTAQHGNSGATVHHINHAKPKKAAAPSMKKAVGDDSAVSTGGDGWEKL